MTSVEFWSKVKAVYSEEAGKFLDEYILRDTIHWFCDVFTSGATSKFLRNYKDEFMKKKQEINLDGSYDDEKVKTYIRLCTQINALATSKSLDITIIKDIPIEMMRVIARLCIYRFASRTSSSVNKSQRACHYSIIRNHIGVFIEDYGIINGYNNKKWLDSLEDASISMGKYDGFEYVELPMYEGEKVFKLIDDDVASNDLIENDILVDELKRNVRMKKKELAELQDKIEEIDAFFKDKNDDYFETEEGKTKIKEMRKLEKRAERMRDEIYGVTAARGLFDVVEEDDDELDVPILQDPAKQIENHKKDTTSFYFKLRRLSHVYNEMNRTIYSLFAESGDFKLSFFDRLFYSIIEKVFMDYKIITTKEMQIEKENVERIENFIRKFDDYTSTIRSINEWLANNEVLIRAFVDESGHVVNINDPDFDQKLVNNRYIHAEGNVLSVDDGVRFRVGNKEYLGIIRKITHDEEIHEGQRYLLYTVYEVESEGETFFLQKENLKKITSFFLRKNAKEILKQYRQKVDRKHTMEKYISERKTEYERYSKRIDIKQSDYRIYGVFIYVLYGPFINDMKLGMLLSSIFPLGKVFFGETLHQRQTIFDDDRESYVSKSSEEVARDDDEEFELFVDEEQVDPFGIELGEEADSLQLEVGSFQGVPLSDHSSKSSISGVSLNMDAYNPSEHRYARNRLLKSEIDPLLDILNSNPVYDIDDDDDSVINISE